MLDDRKLGVLFLVVGLALAGFVIPAQSPKQTADSTDAPSWLVPVLGALLVAVAGGVLAMGQPGISSTASSGQLTSHAFAGLAGAAIYFFLAQAIGYVVVTALGMTCYLRFVARHGWLRSVLMAAVFCGIVYAMFEIGFHIRLPSGVLF